jgi:hypothetical protein
MTWRDLESAREAGEPAHYLACLRYGQFLWTEGLPARSLLAVDRGLFCDVPSGHPVMASHPLPYAAIRWMVTQDIGESFIGNPRVHYQHLADRVRGGREHRVRWRAWAAWAVVRAARPDWPADPRHEVTEPTAEEIEAGLRAHGVDGEPLVWNAALSASR